MFNHFHKHLHHARDHFSMGRTHGGRGFGHFAGFMGGAGPDGEGFRTGRKLSSGDLQLLILALLAEKPNHGYELIKALEVRSSGFYTPSPGMVYPALTYLEEIGYATVVAEGAKKLYYVTDEGRAHLEQNRERVDGMLAQLERIGRKMADVRRVFSRDGVDETDEDTEGRGPEVLWLARRELKKALHEKLTCSPEDVREIADILMRAAAKIRKV